MATQSLSEKARPTSETGVQQSTIRQARADASSPMHPARPTRQQGLVQETDRVTRHLADDDLAPPAYGEIYGEIRNQKDGLGSTSARVTDDGRVDIRINQLNRRMSQIFSPALRQHLQSVQDSSPPPPYIPPSLGGEEGVPPPPPMNVVLQVVGSRGDVQPFVALGKVLKNTYGHRVRLATHPNFKGFVQENGLEFFSIGGDPSRLMAFMVKNPGLLPGFRSMLNGDVTQSRRDVAEFMQGCWRSCYKATDGILTDDGLPESSRNDPGSESAARPFVADCIIANPPSFAHIHCAEKLGIPLHIMFTMPYSPTQAFPHPLANIQSSNADPQLTNYISYGMIDLLSWQGLGDVINRFRAKCLGLEPISLIWAPGMLQRLKVPHTYCWSPALIPKPKDWGPHISISGYYMLASADFTPAPDLLAFLDAGPAPVYIGFGSIVLDDPNAMTELIFEAVRKTGQRVLLAKGWGGLGADEISIPDGVFMLGNVPHDWLFKHVSCVVHHGGAGTTAAGITAGRPTLVVPFFGDQPFWGAIVARAGAGPHPIPYKQLTADKLADAINFCLRPESRERAKELASKISTERGSDMGAQSFHQYLEVDRLRCLLAPSRLATWRIKRTQVKLSAFAACTLANANLLDFNDLKLFRPQEYYTDEGPIDPISGGFTAFLGTFSNMFMGLVDIPSETVKALHIPSGSSRQQSQASVPKIARKSESSSAEPESALPLSPNQSQTTLNMQDPLAQGRSPPSRSSLALPSSRDGSGYMSDELQGQLSPKQDDTSRNRARGRDKLSSSKDYDMLRPTTAHTSKGVGRIVKAIVQGPMDISLGMTKGAHNLPKLWGDDTVRPQERVNDFKSGAQAVGKEFGFGFYDGITGLFTQPWQGAQKEGASGFFKGVGKGVGGFVAKPTAALLGVPSYMMKGVHKEVQKLYGSNVQSYIVASRAAQGYEDWLQSSDAEKQDVIARWKTVEKYMKKKHTSDEMVSDVLEAERKQNTEDRDARQHPGRNTAHAPTLDPETTILAMGGSRSSLRPSTMASEASLDTADIDEALRLSVSETPRGAAEADADPVRAIEETVSQIREIAASHQADQDGLRQPMAANEAEAQRRPRETLAYENQLNRVMTRTLTQRRQGSSDNEWDMASHMGLDDEEDEEFERARRTSEERARTAAALGGGAPAIQQPPSYDQGHLAGVSQSGFEAQAQQQGEKTTRERTEEEIVMEYVKKQSLLERHHQKKGKGRATATEDQEDEDLQRTLKMSMQEHERGAGSRYG